MCDITPRFSNPVINWSDSAKKEDKAPAHISTFASSGLVFDMNTELRAQIEAELDADEVWVVLRGPP